MGNVIESFLAPQVKVVERTDEFLRHAFLGSVEIVLGMIESGQNVRVQDVSPNRHES